MARALRFGTWLVPTHLVKASPQVKIVAFASVFGAYWLAFPWMLTVWGMPSRVFAVSYIVLAALLWGLKGGLLVALVNIPVVNILLKVLGIENIAPVIGPIITLSLAAIVGRLTDLSLALVDKASHVNSGQEAILFGRKLQGADAWYEYTWPPGRAVRICSTNWSRKASPTYGLLHFLLDRHDGHRLHCNAFRPFLPYIWRGGCSVIGRQKITKKLARIKVAFHHPL